MAAVSTVGDLTARHLGLRITLLGLHRPGDDWNAPAVEVTGRLAELRQPFVRITRNPAIILRLTGAEEAFHQLIGLDHPVRLEGE